MTEVLEKVVEAIRHSYELVGSRYDEETDTFNCCVAYPQLCELLTLRIGALAGVRTLDVGCGSGRLLTFLRAKGVCGEGVDITAAFVAKAKAKDLLVREGSMLELPWATDSFDAVVSYFSLNCVPINAQYQTLREEHRVLRRGGILVFACAYPHSDIRQASVTMFGEQFELYLQTEVEIASMLRSVGFIGIDFFHPQCPPCNLEEITRHMHDSQAIAFVKNFERVHYALFVTAEAS